jgi:hypothetical protein
MYWDHVHTIYVHDCTELHKVRLQDLLDVI